MSSEQVGEPCDRPAQLAARLAAAQCELGAHP
jgi:hypothetical protein